MIPAKELTFPLLNSVLIVLTVLTKVLNIWPQSDRKLTFWFWNFDCCGITHFLLWKLETSLAKPIGVRSHWKLRAMLRSLSSSGVNERHIFRQKKYLFWRNFFWKNFMINLVRKDYIIAQFGSSQPCVTNKKADASAKNFFQSKSWNKWVEK